MGRTHVCKGCAADVVRNTLEGELEGVAEQPVETLSEEKFSCCSSQKLLSERRGMREVSSGIGCKLVLLLRQESGQGDNVGLDLRRVFACADVRGHDCSLLPWTGGGGV